MKKKEHTNSEKKINKIFVVNGEMIEDNGEDWFVYSYGKQYGLVCVLDGCGGIGSRKYAEYENKSGAYIASHISAQAIYEWFSNADIMLSGNTINNL